MKGMFKTFIVTFASLLALCTIGVLVLLDSADETYIIAEHRLEGLPASVLSEKKLRNEAEPVCLVITDSTQDDMADKLIHMYSVLDLMRIGYDTCDLARNQTFNLSNYKTVVIALYSMEPLAENVDELISWVNNGGQILFQTVMDNTPEFQQMAPALGINSKVKYTYINSLYIDSDFMIGSQGGMSLDLSKGVLDRFEKLRVMNITLDNEAKVYVRSDDARKIPLIWSWEQGKGRAVYINYDFFSKLTRGMTCAAFALLDDTCVYPVINAASFFIDDFPSPVPFGTSKYTQRDYNLSIADFYTKVWWPDMLKMANEYGIEYTGLLIEHYTDNVTGEFPRQSSTERYNHFGASLMNEGGEIGLHGYNHQPLVFSDYVYEKGLNYNVWLEESDMKRAFDEFIAFAKELYPELTPSVYIPPSNILSKGGREFLVKNYPQIKTISGLYLGDEDVYVQEFEIADDGIIEFPRLTSDSIMGVDQYFSQMNALTMYYVASHFIHPDDALDPERGAELGWQKLYENTIHFFDWVYSSAKGLRSLTASDGSQAIARYDTLSVNRIETDDSISLRLNGFWDEAYFLMRFNDGVPGEIIGGTIEQVSDSFYLLRATAAQVIINKA